MEEAKAAILAIVDPPKAELGKVYNGRVVNITKFGAFVNILPGRDGLVHISKLGRRQAHQRRRGRALARSGDRGPRRRDRRQGQGQPEPGRRRARGRRAAATPAPAPVRSDGNGGRRQRQRRRERVVRGRLRRRAGRRARATSVRRARRPASGARREPRRRATVVAVVAATAVAIVAVTAVAAGIADALHERAHHAAREWPDDRHRSRPWGAVGGDRRLGRRRVA